MSVDKSIKPKLSSFKRGTNPSAKLAGFQPIAYLALHAVCLGFPDRPKLTDAITGRAFATAIVPAGSQSKPFLATPFAKVEVVPGSIDLGTEGDFSKGNTAVTSTVDLMMSCDADSVGISMLMFGADVHVVLQKYNEDMIWLGSKNVPAKVIKFSRKDNDETAEIKLTVEFKPYAPLYLPDDSLIDTEVVA